jgi:predicted deacylase
VSTQRLHRFDNLTLAGVEFPIAEVQGASDGPTVCLLAGVHGCEYSSIQAVRTLMRELDPSQLSGRVRALAFVNPVSFLTRTPFVSPQDGKNPNRSFPGDRDGSFTEALTYHVFHELIAPSDYLIDLHGGDQVEALHPFVIFDESEVDAVTRRMAVAFGFENLIQVPRAERIEGSSIAAAADAGIPAILAEAGGRGLLEQSAVDLLAGGVRSVLSELGVLAGDPLPPQPQVLSRRFAWLYAPEAGWWSSEVAPGDEVAAGQRIGAIEDLFGDEIASIEAPEDGVVLFQTSVPAVAGNGILCGLGTRREAVV